MKKNKKRGYWFLHVCFTFVLVVANVYLVCEIVDYVKTTQDLKGSIHANQEKYVDLKDTKKDLELAKKKLTNPDYVEYLARGKYLVTKEGEQVFKFPKLDE